jgi:hypothetical protein
MKSKFFLQAFACALALLGGTASARADLITFDGQVPPGPSLFADATAGPVSITTANATTTFSGGTILTNATNLPADETSLYGTASFTGNPGYTNPMTITFSQGVTNFIADIYNGQTFTTGFLVQDNLGDSQMFNLPPNLNGGQTEVDFGTQTGITSVTINQTGLNGADWDFFVDNVQFDVSLPGTAPEPTSLALFGIGIAGLAGYRWRQRRKVAAA